MELFIIVSASKYKTLLTESSNKYGKNNPNARKVICLNDNKIFNTGKECAEYYKLAENTILKICKGITKKSRTGLVFMYYDEFIQQQEQQDQAAI